MNKQLMILLLLALTVTAYASNSSKANRPKAAQQARAVKDTTTQNRYGTREYDPRLNRALQVVPK